MNILFFSEYFPPEHNAAASRVFEQVYYWKKWGHSVTVITTHPNFPEGKLFPNYKNTFYHTEKIEGIQVIRVKTFIARNKGFWLRSLDYASYLIPALIVGLLQKKPDIILANCPTPFAGLVGICTGFLRRVPCILEVSDLWPASIVAVGAMRKGLTIKILEKFELFLYKSAHKVIVLTPAFKKNLIRRRIDPKKIYVVVNAVDLERFFPRSKNLELALRYQLNSEYFIAGYIGTFGMAHGLENILSAAELLKSYPDIHFLLIGAGAEREKLLEWVEKKELSNVTILAPQSKAIIPEFWSLCNIALVHLKNSPVFSEVIPSKIFEAMGMGIPILIAAPEGEASQLIQKEEIGLSVAPENPQLLAEKLLFCKLNPRLLQTIASQSVIAAKKYSRENQAECILKIIQSRYPLNDYKIDEQIS